MASDETDFGWMSRYTSKSPTLFFRDGKRPIDYVLVYDKNEKRASQVALRESFLASLADYPIHIEIEDCYGNNIDPPIPTDTDHDPINIKPANVTMLRSSAPSAASAANESNAAVEDVSDSVPIEPYRTKPSGQPPSGMERSRQSARSDKELVLGPTNLAYVKLHVPWDILMHYAELIQIRKPLKKFQDEMLDGSKRSCECLRISRDKLQPLTPTYTWPFAEKRKYLFDIPEQKENFFTTNERTLVIDYILRRIQSSDADERENDGTCEDKQILTDLTSLLKQGVFLAAYPLHEPERETAQPKPINNRTLLKRYWSSYKMCMMFQPINYVRYYFGEAIAFYFAWLQFYTLWLIPVAILGLVIFLLGLLGMKTDPIVSFVCENGTDIAMCPLCPNENCKFWTLEKSCLRTKLNRLVDNEGTVIFGIVMALWEMWKRQQIKLAYRWSVFFLEPVDQPPRPEFMALLKRNYPHKVNPITGADEPHVPFMSRKLPFGLISYSTVLLGVVLTLAGIVGVIFYKIAVKFTLMKLTNPTFVSMSGMFATLTGSLINLLLIFIMKAIYDKLAVRMTELENHRTQFDYDNSLSLKLYLLQFVNYYSSVFYIAFIQGTTNPLPGEKGAVIQSSGCDQGDCLFELFTQLIIIMVGKQFMSFLVETFRPLFIRLFYKLRAQRKQKKLEDSEIGMASSSGASHQPFEPRLLCCRADYTLLDPGSRPLFDEYLEMLIQYGFLTMFVPAFPLAPFFAWLNNVFEIRGDAKKFTKQYRRPVLERVKSIGVWLTILMVISSIAIRTNACIIAFTTDFIDRMVYKYEYSPDGSLRGYMDFTLSSMNANRFDSPHTVSTCRYRGYRESKEPYKYTSTHYHVLAAKFIFVFLFETISVLLTSMIATLIKDVPDDVRDKIYRERALTNEAILMAESVNKRRKTRRGFNPDVMMAAVRQARDLPPAPPESELPDFSASSAGPSNPVSSATQRVPAKRAPLNSPYSRPTNLLEIDVTNPLEHAEGKTRFTDYEIITRTNLPIFKSQQSSVRRRFRDFVWLRKELDTASRVSLPDLPTKGLMAQMPFSKGKGIFDPEFIEARRVELEVFINNPHMYAESETTYCDNKDALFISDYLDQLLDAKACESPQRSNTSHADDNRKFRLPEKKIGFGSLSARFDDRSRNWLPPAPGTYDPAPTSFSKTLDKPLAKSDQPFSKANSTERVQIGKNSIIGPGMYDIDAMHRKKTTVASKGRFDSSSEIRCGPIKVGYFADLTTSNGPRFSPFTTFLEQHDTRDNAKKGKFLKQERFPSVCTQRICITHPNFYTIDKKNPLTGPGRYKYPKDLEMIWARSSQNKK